MKYAVFSKGSYTNAQDAERCEALYKLNLPKDEKLSPIYAESIVQEVALTVAECLGYENDLEIVRCLEWEPI